MEHTQARLEEIRSQGYEIDFSYTFNDAFEIYKRIALMAGLALIVSGIVLAFIAAGIATAFGLASGAAEYFTPLQLENLTGVNLIIYITSSVVLGGFMSPFLAGLMMMARNADTSGEVSFGDAFSCYKQPYFLPLFIQSILISSVSVGISTVISTYLPALAFLGTLFSLFVSFMTLMTVPLILFGNLQPVEAIKGSFVVVTKKPLALFGLMFVALILASMGIIVFCIGIFFTIPFVYVMYYSIYKHSVGISVHDEIEDIGEYDRF